MTDKQNPFHELFAQLHKAINEECKTESDQKSVEVSDKNYLISIRQRLGDIVTLVRGQDYITAAYNLGVLRENINNNIDQLDDKEDEE